MVEIFKDYKVKVKLSSKFFIFYDFIEENNLKLMEKELEIELYGDDRSDEIDIEFNIDWRPTYYQGMPPYDNILRSDSNFKLTRWTYTMMSRKLHLYEKNLKN